MSNVACDDPFVRSLQIERVHELLHLRSESAFAAAKVRDHQALGLAVQLLDEAVERILGPQLDLRTKARVVLSACRRQAARERAIEDVQHMSRTRTASKSSGCSVNNLAASALRDVYSTSLSQRN